MQSAEVVSFQSDLLAPSSGNSRKYQRHPSKHLFSKIRFSLNVQNSGLNIKNLNHSFKAIICADQFVFRAHKLAVLATIQWSQISILWALITILCVQTNFIFSILVTSIPNLCPKKGQQWLQNTHLFTKMLICGHKILIKYILATKLICACKLLNAHLRTKYINGPKVLIL